MKMLKTKKFWYIFLFAILYLIVAFSSFWHACAFFGLANNSWMSIILAFAFEIGQAAVLFSLLTSVKDRSRIMPWILMTMFTLVQVIGNVFSSYKYIMLNSVANLRYFKEPIFIWTSLPDDQATVIITYIVGAILPLCALFLTSMITNYLSDEEMENKEKSFTETSENIDEHQQEINRLREELIDKVQQISKYENEKLDYESKNDKIKQLEQQIIDKEKIINDQNIALKDIQQKQEKEIENIIEKPSHFVNI